jgi:uncharacterized protein YggE
MQTRIMKEDKHFHGTMDVSGIGRVNVTPDEAIVNLTTITEAQSASEAVAINAEVTQAVVDAVSALPNHRLSTSGLAVNPLIDYDDSANSRIIGYRATNSVTVKTKIGYAAQVFDAGIQAGANDSSGISFGLRDQAPFREEALRLAIQSACNEARIVAEAADIEIEGPESILIDSGSGRVMYVSKALERSAPATPVIPEDMVIAASVQIVFRTKPC